MDCWSSVCCLSSRRYRHDPPANMTDVQERRSSSNVDWTQRIQLCGMLFKKPFGHQSTKWSKRFFVIRDGFLLYYPENEKKDIERRGCLNIHPKGIIPLAECRVTPSREQGQAYAFYLDSEDINGRLLLAADSGFERDKWIDMLDKSKRISWKNAQLADNMIRQLEEQGLQMAKQKQDYFDQLQSEVMALADEREKAEELERVNQELEKEKQKMEKYQEEIMEEYEKLKGELEETVDCMKTVESDRILLSETLQQQQDSLQSLNEEKEKIIQNMKNYESDRMKLTEENQNLHLSKEELQSTLKLIEVQTRKLLNDKAQAEEKMKETENRAILLEEEKQNISDHASELKETIKDLKTQKEMTEAELKEEVIARLAAERKLKDAENSLNKLDTAVESQTPNINQDVKEEMVVNVNKLKRFFEDLATEAKIDSDKPVIMKNTIHARKTIARRAKTKKFQRHKSSIHSMYLESFESFDSGGESETENEDGLRARKESCDGIDTGNKMNPLRRAVTTARKGVSVNFPLDARLTFEEDL